MNVLIIDLLEMVTCQNQMKIILSIDISRNF